MIFKKDVDIGRGIRFLIAKRACRRRMDHERDSSGVEAARLWERETSGK
jgi:hypothetical protein